MRLSRLTPLLAGIFSGIRFPATNVLAATAPTESLIPMPEVDPKSLRIGLRQAALHEVLVVDERKKGEAERIAKAQAKRERRANRKH